MVYFLLEKNLHFHSIYCFSRVCALIFAGIPLWWQQSLSGDGQQFHQYRLNEQLCLTSNHWKSGSWLRTDTKLIYGIWTFLLILYFICNIWSVSVVYTYIRTHLFRFSFIMHMLYLPIVQDFQDLFENTQTHIQV